MIKRIERPFSAVSHAADGQNTPLYYGPTVDKYVDEINKALDSAVEVYTAPGMGNETSWVTHELESRTHKALLINIEPIREDTCADVLREMLNTMGNDADRYTPYGEDLASRAKAALERENG